MRILSAGLTDVGRKRSGNEDCLECVDKIGLYLVADGMGGHAAGEVASHTAVSVMRDFLSELLPEASTSECPDDARMEEYRALLEKAVFRANERIFTLGSEDAKLDGMGTTLSGALIRDNRLCWAHVGDSRIYRLRDGSLQLLTVDHSWVNEQLLRNMITEEEARNHRWRNVITRAIGHRSDLEVDTGVDEVLPGDVYLLCSDGLTGMVDNERMEGVLREMKAPADACRLLVDMANEAGGLDNITVIVLQALS
jgi:protein phosphatase